MEESANHSFEKITLLLLGMSLRKLFVAEIGSSCRMKLQQFAPITLTHKVVLT